jgi:signal peptide peptidase SppA
MPDYSRIMALVQSSIWFIEPRRGQQIAEAFLNRIEAGATPGGFLTEKEIGENRNRARVQRVPMPPQGKSGRVKDLAILPLIGAVLPRGDMMADMSGGGAINLTRFQREFAQVASDDSVGAILLEIDSPGGQIDLVPETAQMIRAARKSGRPIVAIANTMAASAAYWIAAAADEIVVTPSGVVGSIGVFQLHQNLEGMAAAMGVVPQYIFEGPRKIEGNPFQPMDDAARGAFQAEVRAAYEHFTADVAAFRGVTVRTVRADPEGSSEKTFGGGRAYSAPQLRAQGLLGSGGMADRVATLQQTVDRLMGRPVRATGSQSKRASTAKARLALM